ncbi:MAG: hypothetical protein Q7J25_05535 [Vicinamibacterales bacterium]|nr:hypothetical protein [Vicinamibacterales bacterium]
MKLSALFGCALLIATLSDSRLASQSAPAPVPETQLPETWLEGSIGPGAAVRVFIESAGWPKDGGLWGMYYYTKYWTPIALEGDWISPGRILMYEGDPGAESRLRPRFDLQLSAQGAVTGAWTSADGRRRLPVRLHRIARPPPFDIAIQRARRFADPRWPIEISYPEGWFLQVTDMELVVRSPDPQDMLFDNELRCERGRGLPPVPGEQDEPQAFQGGFYRTRAGWRVRVSNLRELGLEVPRTRVVGSMTFMSAETAYRAHNAWGYAGIGEGKEHLMIDGYEWVLCYDRLLDSDDRIQPRR